MVGTILPIGYGERARGELPMTIGIHVTAYLVGAIIAGAALGALGSLWVSPGLSAAVLGGIACLALGYAMHELRLVRMPTPEIGRQVRAAWRMTIPPRILAFAYGLELGTGLTTFVPSTAFYVVVLWVVVRGSAIEGATIFSLYAVGRATPFLIMAARTTTALENSAALARLRRWSAAMRLANGYLLALAGGAIGFSAWVHLM